ncbi:MAG: single-strand selective monofunctional uracil DNA glycosylase [Verrucomicrobiales bacterium]|jgi:single-strand selective monofunctional uracil DNA glycosylase
MSRQTAISKGLLEAADELCEALADLRFAEPTTHIYNPLVYARRANQLYLKRFGGKRKRCVMMGMNPGPWGMAQTGIPFGEVAAVRDWMGIEVAVDKPELEHPKRPIDGFACQRSEVSGRRLWGLFSERYPDVGDFFAEHFVLNYCPLVFMELGGKNRTPDKLPRSEAGAIESACDVHLARVLELLQPEFAIGVGAFAETRLNRVAGEGVTVGKVLHPSPASPAANRGWAEAATKQLVALGLWER